MPRYDQASRCSGAAEVVFRWYGNPQCESSADNVEAAVSALMGAISGNGRIWNPWNETMARREFRSRIVKASQGALVPVDHVKPVDIRNPPPMYEIRWQDVAVAELEPGGSQRFRQVLVRMYHSEPYEVPSHFIGHHAHEKDVTVVDINAQQNEEIATAVGWYEHGRASRWGIAGYPCSV
ncbi:hypothetical protein [Microbacterium sp. YY-01]|uniref:hypothetical protein n=1 Tax=Microbacterium sp. YY-01 TaxID=3421634 RepID=UPI003D173631